MFISAHVVVVVFLFCFFLLLLFFLCVCFFFFLGGGGGGIRSTVGILALPFRPLYNNMSLLSFFRF